jgi:hypothetical protein
VEEVEARVAAAPLVIPVSTAMEFLYNSICGIPEHPLKRAGCDA